MLSNWVFLALISALSVASADAATKRYFSDVDIWDALVVRVILTGMVMAPWVLLNTQIPDERAFWLWIAGLACLDLIALFLYAHAITTAPLAHTLPYLALVPVFSAATSFIILRETISLSGMLGILLVTVGAFRLNSDAHEAGFLGPLRFLLTENGPRLMLAVAFIFSLTASLSKGALKMMPAEQFGPFYAMLLGALVWGILIFRGARYFKLFTADR